MEIVNQAKNFASEVPSNAVKALIIGITVVISNILVLPFVSKQLAKISFIGNLSDKMQALILGVAVIIVGFAVKHFGGEYTLLKTFGMGIMISGAIYIVQPYVVSAVGKIGGN